MPVLFCCCAGWSALATRLNEHQSTNDLKVFANKRMGSLRNLHENQTEQKLAAMPTRLCMPTEGTESSGGPALGSRVTACPIATF